MRLPTELYVEQAKRWPRQGRHILAHFDRPSIVVYQAYRSSIGRFVLKHGYLGGSEFRYSRMSWIKPNFLWMMYRSGWGAKQGQEMTLALRISRAFFDSLLAKAVPSFCPERPFASRAQWQEAVARSSVRFQWDPDHEPFGAGLERRALQIGLRGEALEAFGKCNLLQVVDLSEFVAEQRLNVTQARLSELRTPEERLYVPSAPGACARLGLASDGSEPGARA